MAGKTRYIKCSVIFLWLFVFMLSGCKEDKIKFITPELKVSNVVVEGDSSDVYFKFDFGTSLPLLELSDGTTSLIQTRVKLFKNEDEILHSIARGPYSFSRDQLVIKEGVGGNRYSALFFKSLEVRSSETGKSTSILDVNYDYLKIQVVYPRMGMRPKFISNVATFSRDQVLSILSKNRDTVKFER